METFGGSWSFPSELGTPFLSGELTTGEAGPPPPRERKGRKSERINVALGAGLRQRGGTGVGIDILDLSVNGFRGSTHLNLVPGDDVWLRLPGIEAYQASVAWTRPPYIGCAFVRPLHPAVLEMIVGRARGR